MARPNNKRQLSPIFADTTNDDGFYESRSPSKSRRSSLSQSSEEGSSSGKLSPRKLSSFSAKIFQDSVHGSIMFHPLLVAIIDTPQFQRLRDVKQLGGAYWVFPGACHNRFEHCIGTSYLCGEMLSTLKYLHQNLYDDPIEITNVELLCVKIAGLCHDLGHGPFSHLFDGAFVPRSSKSSSGWTHEQCSCDLFHHLIQKNEKVRKLMEENGIGQVEQNMIKSMIMGASKDEIEETKYHGQTYKKQFLFEIVSNKATGIDCDKFDYFARDTHHVGIKNSFEFKRYFKNIRIMPINGNLQICARDKEESNLYELFHIRWTLHRQVYQHKTSQIIEAMLTEALLLADEKFKISASIHNMERFTDMTDSIFYEILKSTDQDENVVKAREILRNIQNRRLYQYCGEVNPKIIEDEGSKELTSSQKNLSPGQAAREIAECGENISEDDLCVCKAYFSFGKKSQNPLEEMLFFGKDGKLKRPQMSSLSSSLPRSFEEEYLRVYCTNPEKSASVKHTFHLWCKVNGYLCNSSDGGDDGGGDE